jgi:hypothetical protein
MTFQTVPMFVLNASQDICELVLTGQLDLASEDAYNAAALAERTFTDQGGKRPALSESQILRSADGIEAFKEVVAFVLSWIDSFLQRTPRKAEWMAVRQQCYGTVLTGVAGSGQFSESALDSIDELVVQRSAEYGPAPLTDTGLVLAEHLQPILKSEALILGVSASVYVTGAAVPLLRALDIGEHET